MKRKHELSDFKADPKKLSIFRIRKRHILLLVILAALFYFSAVIAAIHFTGNIDRTRESDVIIVLGAGLRHDGRPSWALTRRSRQGAELWKQGIAPTILCTGGMAESYPRTEASACREILLAAGVPASAILLEEQSRSTEENAIYSKRILDARDLGTAVLVSDSFHMLRASWLFQLQGIATVASPVPADRIQQPLFYPYSLVREFLAFHWHLFKEVFGIPLTHLTGI